MMESWKVIKISEAFGIQCIQSVKAELAHKNELDSVLKTNLDYAMKALESMSISKRNNASLQVEGERMLLTIKTGKPVLHYTVWNDNGSLKLLQKVRVSDPQLRVQHIDASHFGGHSCRDEMKSCMQQAHEIVTSKNVEHVELKIACGELHLSYTTPNALHTIYIRPERKVIMRKNLNDVLRVMNQMEVTGEMTEGMLACFHHLVCQEYLLRESQYGGNVVIELVHEGQRVQFLHKDKPMGNRQYGGNGDQHHVIFIGTNNMPMMHTLSSD